MDTTSLILVLIISLLILIPIIMYRINKRKTAAIVLNQFKDLAAQHHITITTHDFWEPGFAIGLDANQHVLIYKRKKNEKEDVIVVDLKNVTQCSVLNEHSNTNQNRVIDAVKLQLSMQATATTQSLVFYDKTVNMHFTNELELAEKWKTIVQVELNKPVAGRPKTNKLSI